MECTQICTAPLIARDQQQFYLEMYDTCRRLQEEGDGPPLDWVYQGGPNQAPPCPSRQHEEAEKKPKNLESLVKALAAMMHTPAMPATAPVTVPLASRATRGRGQIDPDPTALALAWAQGLESENADLRRLLGSLQSEISEYEANQLRFGWQKPLPGVIDAAERFWEDTHAGGKRGYFSLPFGQLRDDFLAYRAVMEFSGPVLSIDRETKRVIVGNPNSGRRPGGGSKHGSKRIGSELANSSITLGDESHATCVSPLACGLPHGETRCSATWPTAGVKDPLITVTLAELADELIKALYEVGDADLTEALTVHRCLMEGRDTIDSYGMFTGIWLARDRAVNSHSDGSNFCGCVSIDVIKWTDGPRKVPVVGGGAENLRDWGHSSAGEGAPPRSPPRTHAHTHTHTQCTHSQHAPHDNGRPQATAVSFP